MNFQLGMKLVGLVTLVAVVVIIIVFYGSDRPISIKISWQDGEVEIGVSNAEIIRDLMRDDTEEQKATRRAVLAILEKNYHVYELREHQVVLFEQKNGLGETQAAVCKRSEFFGKTINLFRPGSGTKWLYASQRLDSQDCEKTPNQFIGISAKVFNDLNNLKEKGKLENFTARIQPDDYTLCPAPQPVSEIEH